MAIFHVLKFQYCGAMMNTKMMVIRMIDIKITIIKMANIKKNLPTNNERH